MSGAAEHSQDKPAAFSAAGHVRGHYANTAPDLPSFPSLRENLVADVCIVGAGLAGLTSALELARAGKDVVLLEAERVGFGASGRNGGFVSASFAESIFTIEDKLGLDHAKQLYRLSTEGVGYVRSTIRDSKRADIIEGHGWLKMIRHGDVAALEIRAERLARDYGAMQTFLSRAQLAAHVSSERYHGGLLDMGPFHIHPLRYCGLVGELAVDAGARIHEGTRVVKVSRDGPLWEVRASKGRVRCGNVIIATSAYGGPVRSINQSILPVSTYVVTARSDKLDEAIRFTGCLGDTRRAGDYYRLVGNGGERRLLWGGRITTRQSVPADLGEKLRHDIMSVYPQLDDLAIETAWAGLMGYAVHKMPLIGRLRDGLWMATAFGGHGLNTTAMGGKLVASAIAGGDDRWRLFEPFGLQWGGGLAGRVATQLEYWRLQMLDRIEERRAER
ncbi:MAG: FAD-dependent oxidoreductase [Nitratireductor sp.]